MKKLVVLLTLGVFSSSFAQALEIPGNSTGSILSCQSIDSTFSPSFDLTVAQIDPTHSDSFALTIAETLADSFPGSATVLHEREAIGQVSFFESAFLKFWDGSLQVRRLANGTTVGRFIFGTSSEVELSCNWVGTIQPIIGVSN
jgi:hypothetical protein